MRVRPVIYRLVLDSDVARRVTISEPILTRKVLLRTLFSKIDIALTNAYTAFDPMSAMHGELSGSWASTSDWEGMYSSKLCH